MGSVQQIRVKWNNHQSNFPKVFDGLLHKNDFVDVTLSCEGQSLKAHKLVLAACSPYFHNLLAENPCKHPIVIMRDFRYAEIEAVVEYMYKGEVNISRDSLREFLRTAQSLQIKGLADDDACDTNDGTDGDNSYSQATEPQLPQTSISRQAVEQTTYSQPQTVYSSQPMPKRDSLSHAGPAKRMRVAEKPPPPQPPAPPINPTPPVSYQPITTQATDSTQATTELNETQIKMEVKQQYDENQDSNMDEAQEPDQIGPESPESDTIVLGDDPDEMDDQPEVMFSHDQSQDNLSATLMGALQDSGAGPSTSSPQAGEDFQFWPVQHIETGNNGNSYGKVQTRRLLLDPDAIWNLFERVGPEVAKTRCNTCGTVIARNFSMNKLGERVFKSSNMLSHLKKRHFQTYRQLYADTE